MAESYTTYKVKFINNKSYWYWSDEECRIGDLVYCTGSQEGILGKIIETSTREFANQKITSVTGHIQLENTEDIGELWKFLDKDGRERIMDALGQKEPYSKVKFINCISSFWTVKGSEGMKWEDFLPFVVSYSESWQPEISEPETNDDCISRNGFLWREIQDLPDLEEIDRDFLINGVLYGTAEMIEKISQTYQLDEAVEFIPGIYRMPFDELSIMAEFPELKIALFYVTRNNAFAVYSESGYPYLTKEVYTPIRMDHGQGYSYISRYRPDEVFRDTSSSYNPDEFDVRFNSPFDKEFRSLDYVVEKDGILYQMNGIDHNNPPYTKNSDWVYSIDGGEAVIHRYKGHSPEPVFPTELEGRKVAGIFDRFAKEDNSYANIKRIVIPEGYRYIGAYAFAGCKNLRELKLPPTITTIGDGAFLKCSKLEEVTLPDSLIRITNNYDDKNGGRYMFKGCTSLKNAYIPDHLKYKDGHPFEICTKVSVRQYRNDSSVPSYLVDSNDKDMEGVCTDQIYAGADLIVHHNEEDSRIELYTRYGEYGGSLIKEEGYEFVPETDFNNYPDQKKIRIISEKTVNSYWDNLIKVEFEIL